MTLTAAPAGAAPVAVGSKTFTESVILGGLAAQLLRDAGLDAAHRRALGGTRVLWQALLTGEIAAYPDYTGTVRREILAGRDVGTDAEMRAALAAAGVAATAPLGFNNSYALGVMKGTAARLGLRSVSDLAGHPELRFGFSNEFMDRVDGWPALRRAYALSRDRARGLDHDLAYRALAAGDIDVIDVYTTDAEIAYYDLVLLEDDRGHFPRYDAVMLYRADLEPRAVAALKRLEGRIDAAAMAAMNAAVKLDGRPEEQVAAAFAGRIFGIAAGGGAETRLDRLARTTADHLVLVAISLGAAIAVAIPLGVFAARRPRPGQAVLAVTGVIQTVPSLALLVFMIPLLGIGGPPAVAALFLYSLLPIVRNTHAGLVGIAPALRESARALGLPRGARLRLVELPLAAPSILAGIKTSAVINVGTATLGALIGAGGYGQPILTGIRLDNLGLILEGAVPAALLALLVQGAFELAERRVVPKGLRPSSGS
ncbi:MAG: ABC transporter permease subunit [Alphaproteobacteria bacterium]|nr:ABC transporter permease subunit [Alphaproteobacteria bacterium]